MGVSHCKMATHGQGLDGCREEGGELVLRLFQGMESRMVSVGAAEVDGGGTEGGWGHGDVKDGEEEREERRQRRERESGEEEQEEGREGEGTQSRGLLYSELSASHAGGPPVQAGEDPGLGSQ